MTHYMRLNDGPFRLIERGEKTIELRLYDEKRRNISVGDTVIFTHRDDDNKTLQSAVKALHVFNNFRELYAKLPLRLCGYTETEIDTASPEDMNEYYSPAEEAKYGVVGIEIELEHLI